MHHLCILEYDIDIVTIRQGSPVTETYIIMQIKYFMGLKREVPGEDIIPTLKNY
jgi:hypothetical protein